MTSPYNYQLEGVEKIETFNGRVLLADEMGLGKSLSALLYLNQHPEITCVVVVCPATVKYNWQREASIHFNMRSVIIEGMNPPRNLFFLHTARIIIINYDILRKWVVILRKLKPGLIILDECHMIGSRRALRTKKSKALCKGVPHVLALSGTPLTNRVIELYPTLNILRPDLYASFTSYAFDYSNPEKKPWGWEYKGSRNLKLLHKELKSECMIRRRKKDVLKDLPDKVRSVKLLDLEDRKQYDLALKNFMRWIREEYPHKEKSVAKVERLAQIGYLKRLIGTLKLKYVMQWVDSFLQEDEGKIILFAVHKLVVKPLYERYHKTSVLVDGSVTGKKRQQAIDQFTRDENTRVFVGNIQAAGVGWNGTVASNVAFAELAWTPGAHSQAEDRAYRIGTKDTVFINYLLAENTYEESFCKLLQNKQATLDKTLDGGRVEEGIDVYDLFCDHLLKKGFR